jgi:hypothetical protein
MDDFNVSSLTQSKNEWGSRLLTILTPFLVEGLQSIFNESHALCKQNNEPGKYLMTFQNFISRIPNWNQNMIEQERKRIVEKSGCNYLEDLVTCVHIIQLKLLTAIRVGQKQKKIDIDIPKLDSFIHKIYVHIARKMYKNVYLFEIGIPALTIQKNNREIEHIIHECILHTIRESIPIEAILRAYMDETTEDEIVEEIKEETIGVKHAPPPETPKPSSFDMPREETTTTSSEPVSIKFNDIDFAQDIEGMEHQVPAPKTLERLEEISEMRAQQRKQEEEQEQEQEDEDNVKLKIFDEPIKLNDLEVFDMNPQEPVNLEELQLDFISLD